MIHIIFCFLTLPSIYFKYYGLSAFVSVCLPFLQGITKNGVSFSSKLAVFCLPHPRRVYIFIMLTVVNLFSHITPVKDVDIMLKIMKTQLFYNNLNVCCWCSYIIFSISRLYVWTLKFLIGTKKSFMSVICYAYDISL